MHRGKTKHDEADIDREPGSVDAPAWEMIEAGRYQPRRIRGSYPGRELG
jgi:hypothetical protein